MKITTEQLATYGNIPADNYSEEAHHDVDECRQTVGYQEDTEWVCPKFTHGVQHLQEQYPNKKVAGLTCYLCLVKETNDWRNRGLQPDTNNDSLPVVS